MNLAKLAQTFVIDLCKQLGIVAVLVVMALVFMVATEEIGAQAPDLSQPSQATSSTEAPTLQDFTQQRTNSLEQDQMERDLAEVKRSYRGQLEEYRTLHQQFVVARQEFYQLGTLASLETAVQSTQKVFVMRDMVLLSYLKALELETKLAPALDPDLKEQSLYALDQSQKALTRHLEDTQAVSSRTAMFDRTVEFENLEPLYSFSVVFAKQVLQYGELNYSYLLAQDIHEDLPLEVAGQSELERAARGRALDQIAMSLNNIRVLFDEIELQLFESLDDGSVAALNDFEEAYVILQRIVGFLDEVHLPAESSPNE